MILLRKRRMGKYHSRQTLLTKGEVAFFRVLCNALPADVFLCPKVSLADIIDCPKEGERYKDFAGIAQKHVDFVLIDANTCGFVLVIELDDRSHRLCYRAERDFFVDSALASAKIPILHITTARAYNVAGLREMIEGRIIRAEAA